MPIRKESVKSYYYYTNLDRPKSMNREKRKQLRILEEYISLEENVLATV